MQLSASAEVLDRPSVETFRRRVLRRREPVVIRGALEGVPALGWTREHIKEKVGSARVPVIGTPDGGLEGVFTADREKGFSIYEMALGEYLDRISPPSPPTSDLYMCAIHISRYLAPLMRDLPLPAYLRDRKLVSENLWIGPADVVSPLHYDFFDGFLVQIQGRKRAVLFHPRESWRLYLPSTFSVSPHVSEVLIDGPGFPDYERFPKLREVEGIEVVLEPGEILYVPAGWMHQVWGLDETISVNYWWKYRPFMVTPQALRIVPGYGVKWAKRTIKRLLHPSDRIRFGSSFSEQNYR